MANSVSKLSNRNSNEQWNKLALKTAFKHVDRFPFLIPIKKNSINQLNIRVLSWRKYQVLC